MIPYYLYSYAPILILIALVILIAYISFRKRVQQKDQLKKIATRLGLKFSDQLMELSEPQEGLGKNESTTSQRTEGGNQLTELVRTISAWRMEGKYNGAQIRIFSTRYYGTQRKKHAFPHSQTGSPIRVS
jgi:hypothetical protein